MEGFSSNQFSWKKHTLFVVCRDCHSASEARGLNPGCGYDLGRVLGLRDRKRSYCIGSALREVSIYFVGDVGAGLLIGRF